jgi:hypothetical protein
MRGDARVAGRREAAGPGLNEQGMPQWLPPWSAARQGIGYSGRPETGHVGRFRRRDQAIILAPYAVHHSNR